MHDHLVPEILYNSNISRAHREQSGDLFLEKQELTTKFSSIH